MPARRTAADRANNATMRRLGMPPAESRRREADAESQVGQWPRSLRDADFQSHSDRGHEPKRLGPRLLATAASPRIMKNEPEVPSNATPKVDHRGDFYRCGRRGRVAKTA